MSKSFLASLGLSASIALFACAGSNANEDDVRLVPASAPESRKYAVDAVHEIAVLQCDREERCGHIDQGEHFTSLEHCIHTQHLEAGAVLASCRDGVIDNRLRNCMGEIASSDCEGVESLERYQTCTASELCGPGRQIAAD